MWHVMLLGRDFSMLSHNPWRRPQKRVNTLCIQNLFSNTRGVNLITYFVCSFRSRFFPRPVITQTDSMVVQVQVWDGRIVEPIQTEPPHPDQYWRPTSGVTQSYQPRIMASTAPDRVLAIIVHMVAPSTTTSESEKTAYW